MSSFPVEDESNAGMERTLAGMTKERSESSLLFRVREGRGGRQGDLEEN